MRIYEGGPRQDYEEALRSLGAFLDQRGLRELLLLETNDGFVVQGLVPRADEAGQWADSAGTIEKQTFTFGDDDMSRFMDEAYAQRRAAKPNRVQPADNFYEQALRVIGRYIDEQKPRDVFLFEQDRSFVVRLLMGGRTGEHHILAEFTHEEVEQMITAAVDQRVRSA
jgi:hypothetical protein